MLQPRQHLEVAMGLILPLKTFIPALEVRRDCSTAAASGASSAVVLLEFNVPLKLVTHILWLLYVLLLIIQLLQIAVTEILDWSIVTASWRDVWRFAMTEFGALCVAEVGKCKMPELPANSWASLVQVRSCYVIVQCPSQPP